MCQESLETHQNDVEDLKEQLQKGAQQEAELQAETERLKSEVARLEVVEETLQSKLIGRDRKISHLEDKMADMQEARVRRLDAVS